MEQMKQMVYMIPKYAEWFYFGSGIVMIILFIYVLHKIKKVEKRVLLLDGNIKEQLQQVEKQIRENPMTAGQKFVRETAGEKEDTDSGRTIEASAEKEIGQNVEPVMLINDVLEEIFP